MRNQAKTNSVEQEIQELTTFGDRGIKWAKEAAREGKKVIGVMCVYLPEEIVLAHGLYPWLVTGRPQVETPMADQVHGGTKYCGYCNHVIEALRLGELDFLDGMIITDWDDDRRRLGDVLDYWGKPGLAVEVHLPFAQSILAAHWFEHELTRCSDVLGGFSGRVYQSAKINQDRLLAAISTLNKTRQLLRQLYLMRKKEVPPLTGGQYLNLLLNARVMPKEVFNSRLEALMPEIERRQVPDVGKKPRILISTDFLHLSEYMDIIESCGCVVAMSDLELDRNFVWNDVDESGRDRMASLVQAYFAPSTDSRMGEWSKQMDRLTDWVKEYNIDGVIQIRQSWSRPREIRSPYFIKRFTEANIPVISIEREYSVTNTAQIKTRVGAFLEMLGDH